MKKIHILLPILFFSTFYQVTAAAGYDVLNQQKVTPSDSVRNAELDAFYTELSRTVRDGDFKGYAATYHEDAVVVFATRKEKISYPIAGALANWKQGFLDTKAGKQKDQVEFRFSQRIGNETTAHDTGIFYFTSEDKSGKPKRESYVHFDMLLVKKNSIWLAVMEYQKAIATKEEWEALK